MNKKYKNGWYISGKWITENYRGVHWNRYILPFMAWTPWHKSILGSIPNETESYFTVLEFGWWFYRYRFAIGKKTMLS